MAKITFKKGQPVQSLSGSVGRITYRTINGRTYMHRRSEPVLPKNPTRQQRAQFKRQSIIDNCLAILQNQYEDIGEAIAMRSKIRDRLKYLYKKYVKQIKAPTKLQRAIMADYYARFSTENGPIMNRRKPVNDPMKCGKKKGRV